MEIILIELTPDNAFNFGFSLFATIAVVLVPLFGALSLMK